MTNNTDPFNVPFVQGFSKNGVLIQTWGEGTPLLVIPGLEGSGESCLHLVVPAVEEIRKLGTPVQLCLINYSKEKHDSIDELEETIEELIDKTYGKQELLIYSQSFGNLLTAKIGCRNK